MFQFWIGFRAVTETQRREKTTRSQELSRDRHFRNGSALPEVGTKNEASSYFI